MNNIIQKNRTTQKIFELKKFLFISFESLSGDLAWSLVKEGHEVKVYIEAKSDVDVYDGFVEKVSSWEDYKDWADVIIFDDVGFGSIAEKLRKQGKLVIGGSIYTDELEIDREFGQSEMKKNGINVLPSWQFNNYEDAIEFIKTNPSRYVFKPSGNVSSNSKGLLFLSQEEDGRDLLEILEQNKDVWKKKAPLFLLQKYITGVEIGVGAFFNGHDFIYPINVNFEHKRIYPGNIGPFAGEMGTLMYWSSPNNLFKVTVEKMLPALQQSGYIGYVDINCIVNGKGVYPLEFTTRFGYPTIPIQLEGILTPTGEWLYKMAKGENFELKTKKGFQIGVRILVESYFSKDNDSEIVKLYHDLAISFKNHNNLDGVHIEDVKNDKGIWRVAGASGCLLVITGDGTTVEDARRLVYNRVKNIIILNMIYRTDIGSRWAIDSDRLHTWGYLR
ncbi:MAG: phosphoribosylamine--glycine ligase [Patescibacteria group bacterium]|nr:phosphoribosylamine--glycine ligase [Patescibacteria group bacterium]MBU1870833.1 phosphoribosylamine--glycine ligase [Patescibacteria group bacterium]